MKLDISYAIKREELHQNVLLVLFGRRHYAEFPVQYSGQFGLFIALSIFRKACEIVPL